MRAEDYPTPEKYLEGAEIPTYYQFQSNLVTDEDLKPGMVRNLEVDKRLTLPTRTHIRFLVTAQDVLHSFSIPSLGMSLVFRGGRAYLQGATRHTLGGGLTRWLNSSAVDVLLTSLAKTAQSVLSHRVGHP